MDEDTDLSARRPLKSRASVWAGWLSRLLVKAGLSANMISVFSVVLSLSAAGVLVSVGEGILPRLWLLAAAALVQMRLICNLMDGMVAILKGKR